MELYSFILFIFIDFGYYLATPLPILPMKLIYQSFGRVFY